VRALDEAGHNAQVRDDTSFEHVFITEYVRVVRIAYHVLGNLTEAEDIAQEVFYSYYRRYPSATASASAWLHAAAIHTALNNIRGHKRRELREIAHYRAAERMSETLEQEQDPLSEIERTESRLAVRRWISHLPRRQAAVLLLRYSGLSYREISEALGIPVDQIGTALRRAESALRKEAHRDASQGR
jgi:RNA polymerase sigma-70 factor (ECF subfamily)